MRDHDLQKSEILNKIQYTCYYNIVILSYIIAFYIVEML